MLSQAGHVMHSISYLYLNDELWIAYIVNNQEPWTTKYPKMAVYCYLSCLTVTVSKANVYIILILSCDRLLTSFCSVLRHYFSSSYFEGFNISCYMDV
jgi:hypothetical protein